MRNKSWMDMENLEVVFLDNSPLILHELSLLNLGAHVGTLFEKH